MIQPTASASEIVTTFQLVMVPPFNWGDKARGAPGSFSLGAPRFVFLGTLRRGRRRVLLTTVLLVEEPESKHDQAYDQPDFEDEKKDRQKQHGSELPKADAQDSDRGERKHGLHHKIRLKGTPTIRGRSREVSMVRRKAERTGSRRVVAVASPPAPDSRPASASAAIRSTTAAATACARSAPPPPWA